MSRLSEAHSQISELLKGERDDAIREGFWLALMDNGGGLSEALIERSIRVYRDRWGDDPPQGWIDAAALNFPEASPNYGYDQAFEVLERLAMHPETDAKCALQAASMLALARARDLPTPSVEAGSYGGVELSWFFTNGVVMASASRMGDDDGDGDYTLYIDQFDLGTEPARHWVRKLYDSDFVGVIEQVQLILESSND